MRAREEMTQLAWRPSWVSDSLLLLLVAVVLRVVGIDHNPDYDELYHILAAREWLESGARCIAECLHPYDRGAIHTTLVAWSFRLFGESVVAARIPSLVAGTLLVVAVYLWTRRAVNRPSAVTASLLVALDPALITWSQYSRFYALHGLAFVCAAGLIYLIVTERLRLRTALWAAVTAAVCLLVAFSLQVTTLIGLVALGVWLIFFLARPSSPLPSAWRVAIPVIAIAVVAGATLVLYMTGGLDYLWQTYRSANLMAWEQRDNVFFYHSWFVRMYPLLYALFPIAALYALTRHFEAAGFAITVLGIGLFFHSLGGFKGERLVLYILPFFFIVWGIALPPALRSIWERLRETKLPRRRSPSLPGRPATFLLTLAIVFAAANQEAYQTTVRLLSVDDARWTVAPWYRGHSDWEASLPTLRPVAGAVDVVLASSSVKALNYLGRVDGEINRTQLFEEGGVPSPEFSLDPRVEYPVVSEPESIERILRCYKRGLFIIELGHWENPAGVPPSTSQLIATHATEVRLPPRTRLKAFRWSSPASDSATCRPAPLDRTANAGRV